MEYAANASMVSRWLKIGWRPYATTRHLAQIKAPSLHRTDGIPNS